MATGHSTSVSAGVRQTAMVGEAGTLADELRDGVTMVPTRLGDLRVEICGSGPPAVLWHSLFVDSTTWERVREELAAVRRLVIIDGPSHGGSAAATRIFALEECPGAALDVLDHFGISEPVDWVGNAWGGHVGILFAAAWPDRCRSLVTIGTPVQGMTTGERPKLKALVELYRVMGPIRPLVTAVSDALLGPHSAARSPENARLVSDAFRRGTRRGKYLAMHLMLNRPDLTAALRTVTVPTLVVAGADDSMWTPDEARAAAALPPRGIARVVPGGGHVAPLLDGASALVELITTFWREGGATAAPLTKATRL